MRHLVEMMGISPSARRRRPHDRRRIPACVSWALLLLATVPFDPAAARPHDAWLEPQVYEHDGLRFSVRFPSVYIVGPVRLGWFSAQHPRHTPRLDVFTPLLENGSVGDIEGIVGKVYGDAALGRARLMKSRSVLLRDGETEALEVSLDWLRPSGFRATTQGLLVPRDHRVVLVALSWAASASPDPAEVEQILYSLAFDAPPSHGSGPGAARSRMPALAVVIVAGILSVALVPTWARKARSP